MVGMTLRGVGACGEILIDKLA